MKLPLDSILTVYLYSKKMNNNRAHDMFMCFVTVWDCFLNLNKTTYKRTNGFDKWRTQ